jgi:GrpB-like predicted nucleotidyltransferase (UPF0157 family)
MDEQVRSDDDLQRASVVPVAPHNAPIDLCAPDPRWPDLFVAERDRIRSALGDAAVLIEHVGSTSVPGLAAKPIIDLVLAVSDSVAEEKYAPQLTAAGYVLRIREPDWFEHRLFKGTNTDVNLHVFSQGCVEIDRMLLFRDWLRSHVDDRNLYAQAKRELAQRTWRHVQHYADAKTSVVTEIMGRAEAARGGPQPPLQA